MSARQPKHGKTPKSFKRKNKGEKKIEQYKSSHFFSIQVGLMNELIFFLFVF